jgi:choline dehydrogenase-like flavoprotein
MGGQAMETAPERFETVVVGGGQAGLAVGYHLRRRGRSFVVLDAGERAGDPWRDRWDSLRLYTPARYSGLPGLGFPAAGWHYPTKDEVAGYLEAYAVRFQLPVRSGVRVDGCPSGTAATWSPPGRDGSRRTTWSWPPAPSTTRPGCPGPTRATSRSGPAAGPTASPSRSCGSRCPGSCRWTTRSAGGCGPSC